MEGTHSCVIELCGRVEQKRTKQLKFSNEPGSKLLVLGMGDLPPLIGNPYNGYINPYYWVDDHPLLYGNNGSLDPSTNGIHFAEALGVKLLLF